MNAFPPRFEVYALCRGHCCGALFHTSNGTWDVRRFRPNVLIDLEGDGWVEDSWVGRQIQIGAVTLIPTQPCIRCTILT